MINESRLEEIFNDMNEEIPVIVTSQELVEMPRHTKETLCVVDGFEVNTYEITWA